MQTIQIPHHEIEEKIIELLIERGIIKDTDDVSGVDLGLALNDEGMVEMDLEWFDEDDDDTSEDEPDLGPTDGTSIEWLKTATRKQMVNA